jgi:hypothetical protein
MFDLDRSLSLGPDGDLKTVTGIAALRQRLENRLGCQKGEWRYQLSHGVSWLFDVLGQSGDSAAIRQLLTQEILADAEVQGVGEFNVSFTASSRRLHYTIPIQVRSGEVTTIEG